MPNNRLLPLVFFFAFAATSAWAQANDECAGATVISDPSNYCTDSPGDDNSGATASPEAAPSCFGFAFTDVWYTFTAVAADALINAKGATPSNPTGTMIQPRVALYSGTCGNLTEIACVVDGSGLSNVPLFVTDLIVGQQYYIRVDGVIPGLFQICVENKEALNVVSGDCPTATFVCSKDPIYVEQVFGPGNNPNEMSDAPCLTGFPGESSAAWYVFTAANNGRLEFTITPNDPNDDIDFVLYRLPNGPGDCTGKVSERCMAAGDIDPFSPCMGPTGLNATATDINQGPGCPAGMDNFLRFLTLVPDRTYALVINNFTAIGNGFTLEWGGTALFKGSATANFKTDEPDQKICLGEEIVVTDSSFVSSGQIVNWHWDFGSGATPDTIGQAGPHTVQYTTVGPKSIVLTVTTDEGCVALDTAFLLVQICCVLEASVDVQPGCPDDPVATATVDVVNGLEPLTITWSNGQVGDETSTEFDSSGVYSVVVEDANGCKDSLSFEVETPLDVSVSFPPDTSLLQGQSIELEVTAQPANNVSAIWTPDTGSDITGQSVVLSPIKTTIYVVKVDNMGCIFEDSLTITVREPMFEVPNAFSPNGDGKNDKFGPVNIGYTFLRMEVWSRWGEKIYDSELEGNSTWDGRINGEDAPSDVYVYRIRFLNPAGTEELKKGDITLLR